MDFISFMIVAVVSALQCLGTFSGNILQAKPSKQSSTWGGFVSQNGNDGDMISRSITEYQSDTYWEGDLGGFYNVTKVTVRSNHNVDDGDWIGGAVIEFATSSIGACPGGTKTYTCGQWPDVYTLGESKTFHCTYSAVRYVRIRREVYDRLCITEVAVEGVPSILPGQQYFDKVKSKKVTTPIKSMSVNVVTECCVMCHTTQSCLAFSFSKSQQPNCLLAVDTSMTNDGDWIGYVYNECLELPTACPPIG